MCGCGGNDPNDGGVPGSPPGGTTGGTGLCCTCPANGDVNTTADGTYFTKTFGPDFGIVNKCRIEIDRTASAGTIKIIRKMKESRRSGATAAHMAAVKTAVTNAFSTWNTKAGSYKVRIEQPGCTPQDCTIQFDAQWVATGHHVEVVTDGTPAPPPPAELLSNAVGGTQLISFVNDTAPLAWTMIHESGHTIGLMDEYSYDHPNTTAPTLTIKGASDPDHVITFTSQGTPAPGPYAFDNPTVMGQLNNNTYTKYHFYWIAIEVQRILLAEGASAVVKVV